MPSPRGTGSQSVGQSALDRGGQTHTHAAVSPPSFQIHSERPSGPVQPITVITEITSITLSPPPICLSPTHERPIGELLAEPTSRDTNTDTRELECSQCGRPPHVLRPGLTYSLRAWCVWPATVYCTTTHNECVESWSQVLPQVPSTPRQIGASYVPETRPALAALRVVRMGPSSSSSPIGRARVLLPFPYLGGTGGLGPLAAWLCVARHRQTTHPSL